MIHNRGTNATVDDIRHAFSVAYAKQFGDVWSAQSADLETEPDEMLELIGVSFIASDDHIFVRPNYEYIAREIEWYLSGSLSVYSIPGGPPTIWKSVASPGGLINSNYGHLVFGHGNGAQYEAVLEELKRNPESRRAVMIYTRPSMHVDATFGGKNDFVCTNTVQYFIRDGRLHSVVQMRSNDAVYGYRNDFAWQAYVMERLCKDLGVDMGQMTWQVGSLHIYPRHLRFVRKFMLTGAHE